jgi:cell division protein ZapE
MQCGMSATEAARVGGPTLRERYANEVTARGYEVDAAQSAAIESLEALRTRLLESSPQRGWRGWLRRLSGGRTAAHARHGVYLYGGVGRGKTMLMDLFYESLPPREGRRSHFHHFMRDVHERLRGLRARREPLEIVARELAMQMRVLCLDELYVSDIADAMILGTLFEALLRHDVQLVITSNLAPRELYRDGLQRSRFLPTIALLERELDQCLLGGNTDYRLRQLQRAPIYLDSRAPDSSARLRALFTELAGEPGAIQTELPILGRAVPALGCRADVAWFEFQALCESPRSQTDYIELAREFRTVMLSNVPVFSAPEQDDAARRFIALIDELYDQGTKLVVSAAAAPSELYRQGRLEREFQRTASRLIEMQTPAYLARARRGSELPTEG